MAEDGSYVLELAVGEELSLQVGALGQRRFQQGVYAYVGSAFGPGGLDRIERHRRVAEEGGDPHWHIDHLLVHEAVTVVGDLRFPGDRVECALAGALSGDPVPGFGCSDCDCDSHLFGYPSQQALERDVVAFTEG